MSSDVTQPGLAWYKTASQKSGVLPRCRFASTNRCPRFYQSLSLLGDAGVATTIPEEDDRQLLAAWSRTDLWPRTSEQLTSTLGTSERLHVLNFCPEVSFERFGLFASSLHPYADEIDVDVAHRRLALEKAASNDWRWAWAHLTPMHYTDCPLYSPLSGGAADPMTVKIMTGQQTQLDPLRIALSFIDNSDLLLDVSYAAGLKFDSKLDGADAYSHKTRVRALVPRILTTYDLLDDATTVAAARAIISALLQEKPNLVAPLTVKLNSAGWELRDGDLVVQSPETRELFFPKGSQWDAFVVLRNVFLEARASLTIVDSYCNSSVFTMLAEHPSKQLTIRILCSKFADAVAAEAKLFVQQHLGSTIEVRKTADFHDRFVVADGSVCVHVGASIKDAGKTAFMVSRVEDAGNRSALLQQLEQSWTNATPIP